MESDAEAAIVDGNSHPSTRLQVVLEFEIDHAFWVLQTEGHDGFSFDGSVVDVDVGNVGEADQRHDVAHAENLVQDENFQVPGVISQSRDGEVGELEHGEVEASELGQARDHVIHALVGNAGIGDVQAVDILESGKMSGAQIRHIVIPILLHDQSLQRFDVTDSFHVMIGEAGIHRHIQMFQLWKYVFCLELVEELLRKEASLEAESPQGRRERVEGDEGEVERL